MRPDDVLERATRALRQSADGSHHHASRTRARVLARAREQGRRRRRTVLVLLPMAACLVASVAWGAATGRLFTWLGSVVGRATPQPAVTHAAPAVSARPAEPQASSPPASTPPAASVEPPTESVASAEAPSAPSATPARPAARSTKVAASESTTFSPSAPDSTSVSTHEQSMYASAHHAHFVEHDSAAALRGWDAYLAAYPDGRFALEARYNRAIALVRLGRHDEARAALAPFAKGDYAGYRQHEARELLEALAR